MAFLRKERDCALQMLYQWQLAHAEPARIEAGLLHYDFDGALHPSPLLGRDGAYFGIVQPLPPLKRIAFHFELLTESGASQRIPQRGKYVMRTGWPGVELDEAAQ